MLCKFLSQARTTTSEIHAYIWLMNWSQFAIVICYDYCTIDLIHSTPIYLLPCPHFFIIVALFIISIVAIYYFTAIPLLLLLHYYCYHITLLLINCVKQDIYLGVVELTTQLIRLIKMLWLPLCRINKFGMKYFPRRVLWSPILVGHQGPRRQGLRQGRLLRI